MSVDPFVCCQSLQSGIPSCIILFLPCFPRVAYGVQEVDLFVTQLSFGPLTRRPFGEHAELAFEWHVAVTICSREFSESIKVVFPGSCDLHLGYVMDVN